VALALAERTALKVAMAAAASEALRKKAAEARA